MRCCGRRDWRGDDQAAILSENFFAQRVCECRVHLFGRIQRAVCHRFKFRREVVVPRRRGAGHRFFWSSPGPASSARPLR